MNHSLKKASPFMGSGFSPYTSLPRACPSPPDKPLPQLPSPRYTLFPSVRKPPSTPSSSHSSHSILTVLSVSDFPLAGEPGHLALETVSRPDSCTLPPSPGERSEADTSKDDHRGIFFSTMKSNGFVRFWVRIEHALLEGALVVEGVPVDEAERLNCMAKELMDSSNGRDRAGHVQLLVGAFREGGDGSSSNAASGVPCPTSSSWKP